MKQGIAVGRIKTKKERERGFEFTFDVILFDCRTAVSRFFDVGTVALLVYDAPACSIKSQHMRFHSKC